MKGKKRRVWQKKAEKENKGRERGEERQIGRRADCRVSGCKISGGMLFFFNLHLKQLLWRKKDQAGLFLRHLLSCRYTEIIQIVLLKCESLSCHETREKKKRKKKKVSELCARL